MPRPNYVQCVEKAFKPLVEVADRSDLAPKLKTKAIPEPDAKPQFAKFKALRAIEFEPLFLPNGGFLFPYKLGSKSCLALSTYIDEDRLQQHLGSWLDESAAALENIDAATFLFLSYYAEGYLRLRSEYQTALGAESVIDIIRDDYVGHDIYDLIGYYQPIYTITFDESSIFSDIKPYILATEILSLVPELRSLVVDSEFSSFVHNLLQYPSLDPEKLFLMLTSTRWRYAFLELFRCIESVLFIPWVIDLKAALPSDCTFRQGYAAIRDSLGWRESKVESIQKLFDLVEDDPSLLDAEKHVGQFVDLLNTEGFKRRWAARKINKIRNMLVHHEDFDDGEVLDVAEADFRELCLYLCKVVSALSVKYDEALRAT